MAKIYPFRAYRPAPNQAAEVASVPYDVVNRAEARALAENNPNSFLHVTKPEIDLSDDISIYDPSVYQQGQRALQRLINDNVILQDEKACYYIYALTMNGRTQTGIVCCASVDDYNQNIVRKHEFTRPQKEDDRLRHMEALNAQSGTVFLAHRVHPALTEIVSATCAVSPEVDFTTQDEIQHQLWVIQDDDAISAITTAFLELGPIYIADGHHRSAAASRLGAARPESAASQMFLAVSFPEDELLIMGYNRVVRDLAGRTPAEFLEAIAEVMDVELGGDAAGPKTFGLFLDGQWYSLRAREGSYDPQDPVDRLDVSVLQNQVLTPLLGIDDPRRDERIDFIGGIRGDEALVKRVNSGWAAAFRMHPTSIEELFDIADAEEVMPPKSTWFEPKLRDGLFIHPL